MLAGYTPSPDAFGAAEALGLATPAGPDPWSGAGDAWSYLLQPEGGSLAEAELRAAVLADMGEAGAPLPEPAWPRRDVAWARAALGL